MDAHEKRYWALKAMQAIFSGTSWATKRSSVAKTKQYIRNYRSPYSKTFLAECIEELLIEMSEDVNKIKEWGFAIEEFVYTLYYLSVSIDDTLTVKLEVIGKLELNKKNQIVFFQTPGRESVVNETFAKKHNRNTSHISQLSRDQMKRGVIPNQVCQEQQRLRRRIRYGDLEEMMAFTEKDISLLTKLKKSKPPKPAATIAEALANIISTGAQSVDVELANKNDYTKFVTKSNAIYVPPISSSKNTVVQTLVDLLASQFGKQSDPCHPLRFKFIRFTSHAPPQECSVSYTHLKTPDTTI
ncbi:hypothetical protein CAEBREN_20348 [Caenorhabditis brenneri]|uniref:SPK domain-containing protein n=1 Tax=Caenorhabditis brenneri TaxID=135651 RepID=G0NBC5_CAEBE|nr:hypothetical protein CAEBREN_20348 [Caenorhabditis brenneri]